MTCQQEDSLQYPLFLYQSQTSKHRRGNRKHAESVQVMHVSTAFLIATLPSNKQAAKNMAPIRPMFPGVWPITFMDGKPRMGISKAIFSVNTPRSMRLYDKAVINHKWQYKLSTQSGDASTHPCNAVIREVLPFSPEVFLEHLVRFIVVDDQVCLILPFILSCSHVSKLIHVIECPEFQQLCMVLQETLVDTDIPHRNKMRETIVNHWQKLFEDLKLELSVSRIFISPLY